MFAVAIVGAGPAGVFAAAEVLRASNLDVDIIDRAATPFGLVRYGVAPDHLKIKSVVGTLAKVLANPRSTFLGNVQVGRDVTIEELRRAYAGVVVATGARHGRLLAIPGAHLPDSISAATLVSWYNARPGAVTPFSRQVRSVAVVGGGNVALDAARVLLRGAAGLAETDIPAHVLATMDAAPVTQVEVVVRKGVDQTRFSLPELIELDRIDGLTVTVDPDTLHLSAAEQAAVEADRQASMRLDLFRRWATNRPAPGSGAVLRFRFRTTPTEILGTDGVRGLRVTTPTGERTLSVQAVVHSIGYRGEPVPGLPFDEQLGIVPNTEGRVDDGIYVAGWIKRGPSGIIGTNKACATQSVRALLAEGRPAPPDAAREHLHRKLRERHTIVDWAGWTAIDGAEIALGTARGRPRIKIADHDELVRIGSLG